MSIKDPGDGLKYCHCKEASEANVERECSLGKTSYIPFQYKFFSITFYNGTFVPYFPI